MPTVHHQEYLNTVCWRGQDGTNFHPDHASRRQQNWHDKYLLPVYSVEILLVMDSGLVRNMQSTLSNIV